MSDKKQCSRCNGTGRVPAMAEPHNAPCPECGATGFAPGPTAIRWVCNSDEEDNDEWFGRGPYADNFEWTLRQRLANNRILWVVDEDDVFNEHFEGVMWPNLEAAKADIQAVHDAILLEKVKCDS